MEITIYVNKRNPHKFIEIRNDGHYHNYVRGFMMLENGVVNMLGDGSLHRWRKANLVELLEDYEESEYELYSLYPECSCCGRESKFDLNLSESLLLEEYMSKGRRMGMLQDLFPRVPAWIRSGCIDQYSGGFCICPRCM